MNSTSGSVTKHITIFRCVFLVFSFHKLKAPIRACRKATQVRCLVFVERIITAKVIERVMKKMTWFSDFTIAYLTGTNTSVDALTPKVQKETLECFRSGKVRTCIHPIRFEINTFWWVPLTSLFLSYIFPILFIITGQFIICHWCGWGGNWCSALFFCDTVWFTKNSSKLCPV